MRNFLLKSILVSQIAKQRQRTRGILFLQKVRKQGEQGGGIDNFLGIERSSNPPRCARFFCRIGLADANLGNQVMIKAKPTTTRCTLA